METARSVRFGGYRDSAPFINSRPGGATALALEPIAVREHRISRRLGPNRRLPFSSTEQRRIAREVARPLRLVNAPVNDAHGRRAQFRSRQTEGSHSRWHDGRPPLRTPGS